VGSLCRGLSHLYIGATEIQESQGKKKGGVLWSFIMHKSAEETIQQLPRLGINRKVKVDTARKKPREAMREVIWKFQRVHHDSNMGLQLQLSNWKENPNSFSSSSGATEWKFQRVAQRS
jgi:hypothetical protein